MPDYLKLVGNFVEWSTKETAVRAAAIIGSRARESDPADKFSDLDIWVVSTDPDLYFSKTDWLKEVGSPVLSFVEETFDGGRELRVLFKGGLDVDFAIDSREQFQKTAKTTAMTDVIRKGFRVLLDKDGEMAGIVDSHKDMEFPPYSQPTKSDFIEVVEIFYYRAQWAAKKIARGELWVGKRCCDSTMKELLLKMIEWNVRAREGSDYVIWHGGRFLERWAPQSILEGLRDIFSRYDGEDVRRALFKTVDLFDSIAGETAERMNFPYPGGIHKEVRGLIEEIFTGEDKPDK